ncbi:MAG: pentapeptide repeat-containing protein, partial [Ktedonobacteraceae bacterium]
MNNQPLSSIAAQSPSMLPSWRTEPEIDTARQQFLTGRLAITPDIQRGMYPFRGEKLTRADIEWLLLTHEGGRGPVDWSDVPQRKRMGLDLRGADLSGVNLRNLPLTRMRSGLTRDEWNLTTLEQRHMAGVHLQGADLSGAHLEGAILQGAHLEGATLRGTHLEEANLFRASLKDAYLRGAHLEQAKLRGTHLEGAYLPAARLQRADLRNAFFDSTSNLESITLSDEKLGCALLADVQWGSVNLSVVNWLHIHILGDESKARRRERRLPAGTAREKGKLLEDYHEAVRAHRQLANALRAQGMNEEAVPFAYRAQKLQRTVLWRQVVWGKAEADVLQVGQQKGLRERVRELRWRALKFGAYIFSWFLDILAGYGYKPGRSLFIYLLMIAGFATCYFFFGHLPPREALIFSVTSFHGR